MLPSISKSQNTEFWSGVSNWSLACSGVCPLYASFHVLFLHRDRDAWVLVSVYLHRDRGAGVPTSMLDNVLSGCSQQAPSGCSVQ